MLTVTVITPVILWSRIQLPDNIGRIAGTGTFQPVCIFTFLLVTSQNIQVMNAKTFLIVQQSLQIIVSIVITTIGESVLSIFKFFPCEIIFIESLTPP